MWVSLSIVYLSITFFVLVITEKKNSLARLVMWGRTLIHELTFRKGVVIAGGLLRALLGL